ncbi:hypothetical protein [Flavitalea sp.]|nr:hypothetical protein [Flavitalea sp.]
MKMKLLLTALPILALLLQVSPAGAQQKTVTQKKETRSSINLRSVTTDESGETMIDYQDDGHRHKIRMKGSKIVEMNIDGKKIPEEDFSKYDATVKKILLQVEKDREQADKDRVQAEKDRQQADRDRDQADLDRNQADKDRELVEKQREQAEEDRQRADEDRQRAVQDKKQVQNEREQIEQDRIQVTKDRERASMDRKQAEKDREQAGHDRDQAVEDRKQAELDRKQANEDRKLLEGMINDVVREKIVDNKEAVKSLILDETALTVNGVKQNDSLHNKFKTKYLKKSGGRISYKNSGGSKGVSID